MTKQRLGWKLWHKKATSTNTKHHGFIETDVGINSNHSLCSQIKQTPATFTTSWVNTGMAAEQQSPECAMPLVATIKQELNFSTLAKEDDGTINTLFDDWQSSDDGEVSWIGKMPPPQVDNCAIQVKVADKLSGNIPFAMNVRPSRLWFLALLGL